MGDFCVTLDEWSLFVHSSVTQLSRHNFSGGIGTESAKMTAFAEPDP